MLEYGKFKFSDILQFYGFLRLQDIKKNLKGELKDIFNILNSPDLGEFDKAMTLSRCCRLSPSTQKMSAYPNHSVSKECLDRIFSLAMGLQSAREREAKADKIRNNRFMKNRIANRKG